MTTSLALRELLGLSRSDWARALNVQEITVRRWEEQNMSPGGLAEEIMRGIAAALEDGIDPAKVGALVNLGGIRSLVCYAIVKRARNGHGKTHPPPGPQPRRRRQ